MAQDTKKPSIDESVVYGLTPGEGNKPHRFFVGIPQAAWENLRQGRCSTYDLSGFGIPFQIVVYGGTDHASVKGVLDDHNSRAGVASLDVRNQDHSIKDEKS